MQSSVKTVAVVGPMANAPYDQLGTWVFDGDKTKTVTPLKAIKELVGDKVQVIYEPGLTYSRDKNMAGVAKAAAAAARADVILAFVGEEGYSFRRGALPGRPEPARCAKRTDCRFGENRKTGGYCRNGRASVEPSERKSDLSSAVLYSFHPGTMGGPALADLLWGKAVPSGKTPGDFPEDGQDRYRFIMLITVPDVRLRGMRFC